MLPPETPLEQTQRHVTEGEARIVRQKALIENLATAPGIDGVTLEAARQLLTDMHEFQRQGNEHLERERAKCANRESAEGNSQTGEL